jgi:hypothetical protein
MNLQKDRLKMLKHSQVNEHGLIPNYIRECLTSIECECLLFTHIHVGINCAINYMQCNA